MKILIFSDTHLFKFDEKKFLFLKRIISQADRVIINGDFWEGWFMSFDQFVNSPWKELFPFLKKKNTIYIYGNHDRKSFSDKRVHLFSNVQTEKYTLSFGKHVYIIEHGDTFTLPFQNTLKSKIGYTITHSRITALFFSLIQGALAFFFGKKFYLKQLQKFNNEIKKQFLRTYKKEILICGHTHRAEKDLKNHFIATGCIMHGLGQYVILDEAGVSLVEEIYS